MRYIIHRGCQCKFLDTGIRKVFEKRFAIEKVIAFYGIRKEQPQTFQIHCHVTWPQRSVGEGGGWSLHLVNLSVASKMQCTHIYKSKLGFD